MTGKPRFNPRDRLREIARGERREVVDPLADTDEMHRQSVFFRQRHQNAAPRGSVELGHHEASDPCRTMKRLDLRQRILSHRGIQHQQHRMRRRGVDLLDDANHLFELVHQFGLVLQPAGGVDQQHIEFSFARCREGIEGETRGIRPLRARDHRRSGALAPDLQLLDGSGAKGVAGRQHHLAALGGQLGGQFSDRGGLAGAVDADHQDDERLLCRVDDQRLCHRRQDFFHFGRDHGLHIVGRNGLVVAAVADRGRNPRRHLGAEIGAQQHVLDILEHGPVELAFGDEIGDRGSERTRGTLQSAGQPPPPAQFCLFGCVVHGRRVLAVSHHERKS